MFIDSHCHLHDEEFFTIEESEQALEQARKNNVLKIICIGTSHEDSLVAKEFASKHDGVYWTYGIHPSEAGKSELVFRGLPEVTTEDEGASPVTTGASDPSPEKQRSDLPIAIGEVGLDYHYEGYDRHEQIKLFEEMLQLAKDMGLSVSFHIREAFDDFFAVVANFPKTRGVVHSFSDNKKNLRRILNETEFFVGVNGMATYSTLPTPPLNRILLETDAPFLAPVPHRGEKNEPARILDIARWLAEKLEVSIEEVAEQTGQNVGQLFGI